MKKLLSFLLLTSLVSAMLCGCASQKKVAWQSLSTVGTTVDAAMKVFADMVVAGKITPDKRVQVAKIKADYNAAMLTAISAAKLDYSAPAPADVVNLAQSLISLIQQFTSAP